LRQNRARPEAIAAYFSEGRDNLRGCPKFGEPLRKDQHPGAKKLTGDPPTSA
jgi:hypothetical protein